MNFYPFHIGDYATHTGHLEPMEDLAYRRILDLYYLREAPLPAEPAEVARLIRMKGHVDEVERVLKEFFFVAAIDGLWHSDRCDNEIERMQQKQSKAKASAEASVAARRAKAEQSLSERSTKARRKPSEGSATNTNTNTNTSSVTDVTEAPDGLDLQAWERWVEYRKGIGKPLKPASMPAAQKAMAAFGDQQAAVVEQSIANGWQGLFAIKAANAMGLPRLSKHSGFGAVDYREGINDDGSFA